MSPNNEKELLKAQYETLVRVALANQKENKVPYKTFISFVGSFLLSCFFTWCSSGDTSYFPTLFSENTTVRMIVCFLPFIFFTLYEFFVLISVKRIKKKLNFEYDMCMSSWRKRFREFILQKIGYEPDINITNNLNSIREKMKTHEDVVFCASDFEDFLRDYYKKYKFDVYYDFYKHLAKVILLENEINGTLIYDKGEYTFVVKDNSEVLLMSASYL